MRHCHVPSGISACIRVCARSHAGRASASLALPALVIATSFSRRSSPLRMAIQPASNERAKVARQRRFVERRQPAQVALPDLPGPREDAEQRKLGRAQADAAQFLVVEPADGSRRLTQGAAKAWRGSQVGLLRAHTRCICSESAVVKGRAGARDKIPWCKWLLESESTKMP